MLEHYNSEASQVGANLVFITVYFSMKIHIFLQSIIPKQFYNYIYIIYNLVCSYSTYIILFYFPIKKYDWNTLLLG